MIITVCMNPSFDKTAVVARLLPGETNRLTHIRFDAGGKGVNVAISLKRLGVETFLVGCLGAEDAPAFLAMLAKEGLAFPHILLPGRIRTNLKVLDQDTNSLTEFNEPGLTLDRAQLESFLSLLKNQAKASQYGVLSGSLPVGCPASAYQTCMRTLPHLKWVLDTTGEAFLLGLREKPFLVKPNHAELEALVNRKLSSLQSIRGAALELVRGGAQHVIVSMGGEGALLIDEHTALFSPAIAVMPKSTVGAGDAMLSGVLAGLCNGNTMRDAFRYGVAAAAASVMTEGTQPLNVADFEEMLPKVEQRDI
jgi:1-phosphofructokinase